MHGRLGGREWPCLAVSPKEVETLRKSWDATKLSSMRFTDFYRYVFNEAVPRASALAVFRLFAHDEAAEELSFEHLLLGIAVLTLADEHERRGEHVLVTVRAQAQSICDRRATVRARGRTASTTGSSGRRRCARVTPTRPARLHNARSMRCSPV